MPNGDLSQSGDYQFRSVAAKILTKILTQRQRTSISEVTDGRNIGPGKIQRVGRNDGAVEHHPLRPRE